MGATLFFGLTAAALITHTPPEVTYVSPLETMGVAPFERVLDPVDRPVAVDAVSARPGLRQHGELQVAVMAASIPAFATVPQTQSGPATIRTVQRVAPIAPTAPRAVAPLAAPSGAVDAAPRGERTARFASIATQGAVPTVVDRRAPPRADSLSLSAPSAPDPATEAGILRPAIALDLLPASNIGPRTVAAARAPLAQVEAVATSRPDVASDGTAALLATSQVMPASIQVRFEVPTQVPPVRSLTEIALELWTSPVPPPITAQVTGDSVFLRLGPGTSFAPITQFDTGARAVILETRARWLRVEIGDETGWMFGGYLAPTPEP